jgi:hypothetical protein
MCEFIEINAIAIKGINNANSAIENFNNTDNIRNSPTNVPNGGVPVTAKDDKSNE